MYIEIDNINTSTTAPNFFKHTIYKNSSAHKDFTWSQSYTTTSLMDKISNTFIYKMNVDSGDVINFYTANYLSGVDHTINTNSYIQITKIRR